MIKSIRKTRIYLLPIMSILLVISLLLEPTECISAAKNGLLLWFNVVLPSLLPFIIGANILLASGSVYFFEKLFQPIMGPLFNVPGCSAFAWLMGLVSGYPMGAKIIAELKKNNQISNLEAQRLLSFCNNSGPFFILGAIGVGMFNDEQLGYFLLLVHFFSSVLIGILFRFYGGITPKTTPLPKSYFSPAQSVGEVLGDSVTSAMEVITQIGGYIIAFSVIGTLLKQTYLVNFLTDIFHFAFYKYGVTKQIALSWLLGIIEMSNGVHMVTHTNTLLKLKLAIISFLLAWGGFSIHAQSLHLLQGIDIKVSIYLLGKFLQGIISFILTLILLPIFLKFSQKTVPTFATSYYSYYSIIGLCFIVFTLALATVIIKKQLKAR